LGKIPKKAGACHIFVFFCTHNPPHGHTTSSALTPNDMDIIEIQNVLKTYGSQVAVNRLCLKIPKGKIFGLLGPNGAGKTSLIRMITAITRPDEGRILFDGQPLNSAHPERIGYMPEERGLYKKMKVGEMLLYLAQLKGMKKEAAQKSLDEWFAKFDITGWKDKKVEELSKGQQQKVQFISTVLHGPDLLILDEPFSGLDPVNSNLLKEEILQLHRQGVTILFSTHRMEQVEEMCDEIVLINKGTNILDGPVKNIKQRFKENIFEVEYEGELPSGFFDRCLDVRASEGRAVFRLSEGQTSNGVVRALLDSGVRLVGFREILPSMNDIFIRLVAEDSHA
jgi:ABC-2 type transport system ATP-binding protein